jgi:hypothetical protein
MLRLAADENFNNDIVRALVRRLPSLDIVRAQDAGLTGADDEAVLAWAADQGRILLTHDVSTMTRFAYERVARGDSMPGVFEIPATLAIRHAIEDLVLMVECSEPDEWDGQVRYLPLR